MSCGSVLRFAVKKNETVSRWFHMIDDHLLEKKIDLNSADVDELVALKHIGLTTAQSILDYRNQHGSFQSLDELRQVPGIGPAKFRVISTRLRVSPSVSRGP